MNENVELIQKYKFYRENGKVLNQKIIQQITRKTMLEAARALDIRKGGTLVFESEHEMDVLMDYIAYDFRYKGKNGLERYLHRNPQAITSEDRILIESMLNAKYSIYEIAGSNGNGIVNMVDILRKETVSLIDINLSAIASGEGIPAGSGLAGRLIAPENLFCMSTGAMLPIGQEAIRLIHDYMIKFHPDWNVQMMGLPTIDGIGFSTYFIRTLLKAGVMQRIHYEDHENPAFGAEKKPVGKYPGTSRNAPCPCGSGIKYKKCCLLYRN